MNLKNVDSKELAVCPSCRSKCGKPENPKAVKFIHKCIICDNNDIKTC